MTGCTGLENGGGSAFTTEVVRDEWYASVSDVSMKIPAQALVTLPRKVWAPRPPKTVCELPPKAAPMPPPFPACSRMTRMRTTQAMTWTTVTSVINGLHLSRSGRNPGP